MAIFDAIAGIFGSLREALGFARQKHAANNTPEMRANAAAKTDAEIRADATQAVATKDLAKIRQQAAE